MKVAILWLINEKGEVLLSQRAAHMSTDANMWGPSVSGKVDIGEDAEQAAIREANEELGIDPAEVIPVRHLHDSSHNHSDGRLREFSIFSTNVESALIDKMRLEPDEVAAVKWISLQNLQNEYEQNPNMIIISSNKPLWAEIFENLKVVTSEASN
jgi:isopentenyl-diphosphate delta-isomerase